MNAKRGVNTRTKLYLLMVKNYFIIVIGNQYELRVWPDSHCLEQDKEMWFSHEPLVDNDEINMLKTSFYALIKHIQKEGAYKKHSEINR